MKCIIFKITLFIIVLSIISCNEHEAEHSAPEHPDSEHGYDTTAHEHQKAEHAHLPNEIEDTHHHFETHPDDDNKEDENEVFARYIKEKGIDKSGKINREQLVDILDFFMTRSTTPEESQEHGIRAFIQDQITQFPEEISWDDLHGDLVHEFMKNIREDHSAVHYGDRYHHYKFEHDDHNHTSFEDL